MAATTLPAIVWEVGQCLTLFSQYNSCVRGTRKGITMYVYTVCVQTASPKAAEFACEKKMGGLPRDLKLTRRDDFSRGFITSGMDSRINM